MRIALVSPYSWTYQGGVNGHVKSLAEQLIDDGHEVRVLAPWDPPDRLSRTLHRTPALPRPRPDYLIPLGRTVGFSANGSAPNLCVFPDGVTTMRRELRAGRYDVVHVHEPPAPALSWDACSFRGAPVVGTFHAYSSKPIPNQIANLLGARRKFNQLHARIAVSEAAAWTGRRWFGGEYEVIPNGVDLHASPDGAKAASEELRVLFVGRPEERKGLPVLLRAFEALIEHVPSRLVVVGAGADEVGRYLADPRTQEHIDARGRLDGAELWRPFSEADVLCAPSLAGESFGMILTEAFAAGTPVIASAIAGYSEVVTDGVDGVLVPPGDPQRLAEELQRMHVEPQRLRAMGAAAGESARRYAWPRVAARVEQVYERALAAPAPRGSAERAFRTVGIVPADGAPRRPAERLPSLDPPPAQASGRRARAARRIGVALAAVAGVGLSALAANRVGIDNVVASALRSDLAWVLVATALMMASLFVRAGAWHAIMRSALPRRQVRRRDATSATMIGVLMSATLPARLGEPARAMVMSRRIGRMRETFPVVVGTLVSQTTLNIVALAILGGVIVASTDLFHSSSERVFLASLAPLALLAGVLVAPYLVRSNGSGRLARIAAGARAALLRVRSGLRIFGDVRRGPAAAAAQLGAWGIQLGSCYALATAMGLQGRMGIAGCAAVLFAVNVTAVVPATPSNIGVFQLAVVTVLTTGFAISAADALAYGVILQAVEIATTLTLGIPALVREGMTWSDARLRALSAAPVQLAPHRPRGSEDTA